MKPTANTDLTRSAGSAGSADVRDAKDAHGKSTAGDTGRASAERVRLLLVPALPIYRAIEQAKADTVTELFAKELEATGNLVVVRAGVAKTEATPSDASSIRALRAEAEAKERDNDIVLAIAARQKVIQEMLEHAEAQEGDSDLVLAFHELARAQMWAGQDAEAQATLLQAARMSPSFSVPPAQFSRLYQAWFARAAAEALTLKRGQLVVRSVIPGARIALDGRTLGVAPIHINDVIAGKHFISAMGEGVRSIAHAVEIAPERATEFVATFGDTVGGRSVGPLSDALMDNQITAQTVADAVAAGKQEDAAFVALAGITKDEERMHVHGYVVDVSTARIRPLDVVALDLDLLTAESDILRMVRGVAKQIRERGEGKTEVGKIDPRAIHANIVSEVSAKRAESGAESVGRPGKTGKERGPRKVYGPLNRGSVSIKDDDE
ncbi:MAG: PEGA domain-containing protein [Deltaproteobacteria bacterium]|nr:PEGA domain-containing protein [Deltaproteobacteria bacterium]